MILPFPGRLIYPFSGMNNKKLAGGNETVNS
jgi:hypothetical protein